MPESAFLRLLPLSGYTALEPLRSDKDLVLVRGQRASDHARLLLESTVYADAEPRALEKMDREFALRHELDPSWALRPIAQDRIQGRPCLFFEDPGGEPLSRLLVQPRSLGQSLRLAVALTSALGKLHGRGLIHKDLKPDNALVDPFGAVRLMGFGIASRLPRERQEPAPPEVIAGSLAYMSPEQTGRMNRSIDSRSDLYSLGVTLYELFTGARPFEAREPIEWVHCHIARQPPPPHERSHEVPAQVSAVVMKLLSKTADERYQTALGVEADLRRCLEAWESAAPIASFPLAERDVPTRLLVPEQLYAREREVTQLMEAFRRVETEGELELVFVSGYSGIGKSSLVNELQRAIVRARGLFASGKFEPQRSEDPYFIFAQAFRSAISRVLAAHPDEVQALRTAILDAVGDDGRVLTELLPELELVIGRQPDVPALSLVDARNRFHAVFVRFLRAFARRDQPLVLFLDDLQWLDAASLALFEHIAADPDVKHLLLVGAYRDNDVVPPHPLVRTLERVRAGKARASELHLAPLAIDDVAELVSDTLHCSRSEALALAGCIHEKTAGNPFFTLQFLRFLEEKQLIRFEPARCAWSWDIARIRAQGITANVAELVVDKLERLPTESLEILKQMACVGSVLSSTTLARMLGRTEDDVSRSVWPAVLESMLTSSAGQYRFVHDRVREAAYSLIPSERRPAVHLSLGRLLLRGQSEESLEEEVFLLAEQFNRGLPGVSDPHEQAVVRRLNTIAGRKAMASAAFDSASAHLARARQLLPHAAWASSYEETLSLFLDAGESDFIAGFEDRAEALFAEALAHAEHHADKGEVFRRRAKLHRVTGRYAEALDLCLQGLAVLGVTYPAPSDAPALGAAIGAGMARAQAGLKGRSMAELADAEPTGDRGARAVIALAAEAMGPAYYGKSPYLALIALTGVAATLERGPAPDSPILYNVYAYLLSGAGDFETAQQLTEMSLRLHDRVGQEVARGALLVSYATLAVWRRPFAFCASILEEAFSANVRVGNVSSAGDAALTVLLARFEAGERIERLLAATERYLAFARSSRNEVVYRTFRLFSRFLSSFREDGELAGLLEGAEAERERRADAQGLAFHEKSGFGAGLVIHHVLCEIAEFIGGRYERALLHAQDVQRHVVNVLFTLQERNHPLFRALAAAALYDTAPPERRAELAELVTAALEPVAKMAEYGPENYGDRLALLQAEAARIEGRDQDAMRLYERSIASAREHGLTHREALANEVAARFYALRGFATIARAYLREARSCYLRWGALGKVRQLDRVHPELVEPARSNETAVGAPLENLDLVTVVSASQAMSGEIVLERFMERLLSLMLESAGAERGALIRPEGVGFVVEAEAQATPGRVEVAMVNEALAAGRFPQSMLRFVLRTHTQLLLDDATAPNPHSDDAYVIAHRPRSVLVLPLLKQSQVVAILYLENRLATRAFASKQVALVQLLASQGAVSLENARLYRKLERAEERFSKAFRESPTPMAIFRMADGALLDANARFLACYGYELDELKGRTLESVGAFAPEETERLRALIAERGSLREEEITVRNKLKKTLYLLASLEQIELGGERCALVTHLDVTERKQIESQLRQAQKMEAIGRLAGGVAHDFNNLLTAINGFGALALEDMDVSDPNYDTLQEILKAGERAGALTTQLLAHSRLQPQQAKAWNLNQIVADMRPLLSRLIGEDIRLEAELDPQLALAQVDRGHVEQVLLNLVVNARDALSPPGLITIGTSNVSHVPSAGTLGGAEGPHVALTVRDTGSGMTPEVKSRLFEPFFTTKPPGKGTGLGLSVVYGIVQQSGGAIALESEPGRGTVFHIYFPALPGAAAASVGRQEPRDASSVRGNATILLVEDDEQVRKYAAIALRAQGYRVVEAKNGLSALARLEAHPEVELVVTDVVMPDMGAAALARQVQALHPTLPILFVSGFAEHPDVHDLIAASGGRLLAKPFTPLELATRVREALRSTP